MTWYLNQNGTIHILYLHHLLLLHYSNTLSITETSTTCHHQLQVHSLPVRHPGAVFIWVLAGEREEYCTGWGVLGRWRVGMGLKGNGTL